MITTTTIYPPRSRLEARIGQAARKLVETSTDTTGQPWLVAACVFGDRVDLVRVSKPTIDELRRTFSYCGIGTDDVRLLFTSPDVRAADLISARSLAHAG